MLTVNAHGYWLWMLSHLILDFEGMLLITKVNDYVHEYMYVHSEVNGS